MAISFDCSEEASVLERMLREVTAGMDSDAVYRDWLLLVTSASYDRVTELLKRRLRAQLVVLESLRQNPDLAGSILFTSSTHPVWCALLLIHFCRLSRCSPSGRNSLAAVLR